jgi:hypothetical protein
MRRMLIGVALASALAGAIFLCQPDPQPDVRDLRILGALLLGSQLGPPAVDPEISAMDCRIVAKERVSGDRFLLTEECTWKGGRVEQHRFTALRKGDGPSQGWMYQLAESDI